MFDTYKTRMIFHFRLARTKSGWRAGAPTKIRLAAAGDFSGGGGIRRHLVNGATSHY